MTSDEKAIAIAKIVAANGGPTVDCSRITSFPCYLQNTPGKVCTCLQSSYKIMNLLNS